MCMKERIRCTGHEKMDEKVMKVEGPGPAQTPSRTELKEDKDCAGLLFVVRPGDRVAKQRLQSNAAASDLSTALLARAPAQLRNQKGAVFVAACCRRGG